MNIWKLKHFNLIGKNLENLSFGNKFEVWNCSLVKSPRVKGEPEKGLWMLTTSLHSNREGPPQGQPRWEWSQNTLGRKRWPGWCFGKSPQAKRSQVSLYSTLRMSACCPSDKHCRVLQATFMEPKFMDVLCLQKKVLDSTSSRIVVGQTYIYRERNTQSKEKGGMFHSV